MSEIYKARNRVGLNKLPHSVNLQTFQEKRGAAVNFLQQKFPDKKVSLSVTWECEFYKAVKSDPDMKSFFSTGGVYETAYERPNKRMNPRDCLKVCDRNYSGR